MLKLQCNNKSRREFNTVSAIPWNELIEIMESPNRPIESALMWYKEMQNSKIYRPSAKLHHLISFLLRPMPFVDTFKNVLLVKPRFVHLSHGVQMNMLGWLLTNDWKCKISHEKTLCLVAACIAHYEEFRMTTLLFYAKLLKEKMNHDNNHNSKESICLEKVKEHIKSEETDGSEIETTKDQSMLIEPHDILHVKPSQMVTGLLQQLQGLVQKADYQSIVDFFKTNYCCVTEEVYQDVFCGIPDVADSIYTIWNLILHTEDNAFEKDKDLSLSAFLKCVVCPYTLQIEQPVSRQLLNIVFEMVDNNSNTFLVTVIEPLLETAAICNKAQLGLLTHISKRNKSNSFRLMLINAALRNKWENMKNPEMIIPLMQVLVIPAIELCEETYVNFVSFLEECVFKLPGSFLLSKLLHVFIKTYGNMLSESCLAQIQKIVKQNPTRLQKMCLSSLNQFLQC